MGIWRIMVSCLEVCMLGECCLCLYWFICVLVENLFIFISMFNCFCEYFVLIFVVFSWVFSIYIIFVLLVCLFKVG